MASPRNITETGNGCSYIPPRSRFRETILLTWLSTGFIVALLMWHQGGQWIPTGDRARDSIVKPRSDFMIFYGAALVMRHSPKDLYDQRQEGAAQRAATGLEISAEDPDFLPYAYPAVVALSFIPFTFFPYHTAYFMMIIVNFVLFGMALWLLSSRLELKPTQNKVLVLSATAFLPVYYVFVQGQVSFLILLLWALIITDLRNGRSSRAGIWGGLTAFKPTLLPVFLLWLAARRQWRALGWASLVAGTMAVFSILLVGIDGTADYVTLTTKLAQGQINTAPLSSMYNLNAIVHFLGGGRAVWLAAVAVLLGFLAFGNRTGPIRDWDYCALISGSVLAAPYLLIQELDVMLIVVALMLARWNGQAATGRHRLLLLLMLGPAVYTGVAGRDMPGVAMALLVFFAIFMVLSLRAHRIPLLAKEGWLRQ